MCFVTGELVEIIPYEDQTVINGDTSERKKYWWEIWTVDAYTDSAALILLPDNRTVVLKQSSLREPWTGNVTPFKEPTRYFKLLT